MPELLLHIGDLMCISWPCGGVRDLSWTCGELHEE